MDTNVWRFQAVCTAGSNPGIPFFACEDIEAAETNSPVSCFGVVSNQLWYSYVSTPDWSAIAIASGLYPGDVGAVIVAISSAGQTWQVFPRDKRESRGQIDPNARGFTQLGSVNGKIFACGMGRILFARGEDGVWANISAPWPKKHEGVVGFTAVSGWDESNLCCVGWRGEVWTRRSDMWFDEASPTNSNLNAIAIHPDGDAYIVGDGGVMLKGRPGSWAVVDTDTDFNLQDICMHEGGVYACSDFNVFRLGPTGLEALWDEGPDAGVRTCLRLASRGSGGLISMGAEDVLVLTGGDWQRLG
jgi:photosystem II stability/assembly factor-like uncharacterized protein